MLAPAPHIPSSPVSVAAVIYTQGGKIRPA
jgi:hypothetical protein